MDFNQELDKVNIQIKELENRRIDLLAEEHRTRREEIELELIPKKLERLERRYDLIVSRLSQPSLTGKRGFQLNFSLISIRYDSLLQSIFPL